MAASRKRRTPEKKKGGKKLVVILVAALSFIVLAAGALVVLAVLFLPDLLESAEELAVELLLEEIHDGIEGYGARFKEWPPSRLSSLDVKEEPNFTNEGSEALVLALSHAKGGPFIDWDEESLGNCDADRIDNPDENSPAKVIELSEVVDAWGNPVVYIRASDYGLKYKYVDKNGRTVWARAVKTSRMGGYYNPGSYQIWSFGPNGKNEDGGGDDIANFKVQDGRVD
ncbi:MAG: hypothetical protein ACYS47_14345 [Planctomycetota bacterium]|jgi:hypothetical protein